MSVKYVVQKQLIPLDKVYDDPHWAKRQIWVLKLNSVDTIDEFDTYEEAEAKRDELDEADPSKRIYRVVTRNEDGYLSEY
jgi:hypothetical protein